MEFAVVVVSVSPAADGGEPKKDPKAKGTQVRTPYLFWRLVLPVVSACLN